jgi:hypothetical protein
MSCREDYTAHTEEYRGYTIEIVQDIDALNPFEDWDGEPPIAIYAGGHPGRSSIYEYATRYGNANSVPTLTREQLLANRAEIFSITNVRSWRELIGEYLNTRHPYGSVEDAANEAIAQAIDNEYESKRLPLLETIWRMAGVPALYGETNGYSQSDWAYVLVVATPKFLEATGCTIEQLIADDYKSLQAAIDLYGYWAWGDVYGYVIKDADGEEIEDGSTWGYYGDYPEYGGSIDEAKSVIDNHIEHAKHEHFNKVKTQIKHHVPLTKRTPLDL